MKIGTSLLSSFVALVGLVGVACTSTVDESLESASEISTQKMSAAELASTKEALRKIAFANMKRTDNAELVRAEVDPIIARLAKHYGARPATEKLLSVEGAWRQIWTDFPYPMTRFISMDPTQVYQVVSAEGHYWNIGDEKAAGLFGLTGVLRGAFKANGTRIDLQFTDVGFRFGRLSKNENLVRMADSLEAGDAYRIGIPGGGKAPKGPVNIKGTLETLYVDADLRVDQGTQRDFLDEDGTVAVEGYGPKIFILDRVTTPAK